MSKEAQAAAQQAELIRQQNNNFITYGYKQTIPAHPQSDPKYTLAQNLIFESPIVASATAQEIVVRFIGKVKVGAGADVKPTASFPYSVLGNDIQITYGNKVASFHPIISKVQSMLEGYAKGEKDAVNNGGYQSPNVSLHKIPTTFTADSEQDLVFDVNYALNSLNDVSLNGLLPIHSSGVRLQTHLTLPSKLVDAKADALDGVFEGTGEVEIEGKVEVHIIYRDHNSMATRSNLSVDLSSVPSVQMIKLPTKTNLSPNNYEMVDIRNPYPFSRLVAIVLDGKQSDYFTKWDNVTGFSINKAQNTNSAFERWDETTGGFVNYLKLHRQTYGQDMLDGVLVKDFTTQNIANVDDRTGQSFLNLTQSGFPSGNFSIRLGSVGNERTSKIVSYGVIMNDQPIAAQ